MSHVAVPATSAALRVVERRGWAVTVLLLHVSVCVCVHHRNLAAPYLTGASVSCTPGVDDKVKAALAEVVEYGGGKVCPLPPPARDVDRARAAAVTVARHACE